MPPRPSVAWSPSALRMSPLARREARWGYVFISPWIVGFFVFTLAADDRDARVHVHQHQPRPGRAAPVRRASTTRQKLARRRAGLGVAAASRSGSRCSGCRSIIVLPFLLALGLNSRYLTRLGRRSGSCSSCPTSSRSWPGVLIWQGMLNLETGWVNGFLRFIGVENPPNWLNDPTFIYPALVFIGHLGHRRRDHHQPRRPARHPDRAVRRGQDRRRGLVGQLRNVTLPMMSPVIFYTLVLGMVEVLQYFLVPLVLKNGTGEPGGTTLFYNLYLYKTFFTYQDMSYGATLAWLLFAITLVITLVLFRTSRRWVYYAGER